MKDFEEFEQRFQTHYTQLEVPKRATIDGLIRKKKRPIRKLTFTFAFSFCLLLAVATAGAMEYTGMRFQTSNGAIEITNIPEEALSPHTNADLVLRKNERLMKQLEKSVADGKFLYFMDVEIYEQTDIENLFYLTKPLPITKLEQLPDSFRAHFHLDNTLLENYYLKKLSATTKFPNKTVEEMQSIMTQLKAYAKANNVHYGILEADLPPELHSIHLTYETNDFPYWEGFDITIIAIDSTVQTTEDLSNYEPLANDLHVDMYYSEQQRTLYFIKETSEQNFVITIRNPVISEPNVDRALYVDVAASLLQ